jgi:hypothetical protein
MPGGVLHPILPSFTTGEVSPLMYGRVDFAKYNSSLKVLLNYIIRPHGPVQRRMGTHFVARAKFDNSFTRMFKFEFSTTQAYQLEAGALYFRFFKDGGRIQQTITNAVNAAGLVRITCTAHGWDTGQQVTIEGVKGTIEANATWLITVIDVNTFDLQGSVFVHAYVSSGAAIPEVVTPYAAADLPKVKYVQAADTCYYVHPSYPVQKLVRLSHVKWSFLAVNFLPPATYEAGFVSSGTITFGATTGLGVAITLSVGDLLAADVNRLITTGTGRAIIKTVTLSTTGTVDIVDTIPTTAAIPTGSWTIQGSPVTNLTPSLGQPTHASTTLTLAAAGWRATDVGRIVRVNGGTVRITTFSSTTAVNGEILSTLTNVTASPGGSWSIEDPTWSALRGYPRAIGFMEQRLVLAGNAAQPNAFWGSNLATGYESFALGPNDDDAYQFLVATNEVNTINWVLPTRELLIGTASSEFSIKGSAIGTSTAIGPNNVDVKASTFWGSDENIQPLRIGNAGLFVSRTKTEFREMVFSLQRDSYVADDMLLLAEHLTKGTGLYITDIAYQRHPNSVVWCVRSDGALLGLTYQREHDVVGWHRHITGPDALEVTPVKGKFESVAVTPHWNSDRDVAFFTTVRIINGTTRRMIEYMDDLYGFYGPLGMDCALTYSGSATLSVTGLDHLIGETVQILGDGAVYPEAVVDGSGMVTTTGLTFTTAEVGLGFRSKLQTLNIEVPQQGTSQGVKKHWAKIWVRLYKTIGLYVNGEEKPFRSANMKMDQSVDQFSGDMQHTGTTGDREGSVTLEQRQPLPQTISAIFGNMTVGE